MTYTRQIAFDLALRKREADNAVISVEALIDSAKKIEAYLTAPVTAKGGEDGSGV